MLKFFQFTVNGREHMRTHEFEITDLIFVILKR